MIELEERIAAASEKGPTSDSQIKLLRTAINCVREEFDIVVKDEEKKVRDAGGLHVIGTERHESRRVDNNSMDVLDVKVIQDLPDSSYHLKIIFYVSLVEIELLV